jgi:hypothetical protein
MPSRTKIDVANRLIAFWTVQTDSSDLMPVDRWHPTPPRARSGQCSHGAEAPRPLPGLASSCLMPTMTARDALEQATGAGPRARRTRVETICGPRGACRRGSLAKGPGRWTWCPDRLTVFDDYDIAVNLIPGVHPNALTVRHQPASSQNVGGTPSTRSASDVSAPAAPFHQRCPLSPLISVSLIRPGAELRAGVCPMSTNAHILGLTVLTVLIGGSGGGGVTPATLPKDPCALLKPAEIQALAADAKIGSGVSTTDPASFVVGCTYEWGLRTREWGTSSLVINVTDASKVWPAGLSPDDIKQRVLFMVKTGGPDAAQISGIGDGAVFTTEPKAHDAKAMAFVVKAKGVFLEVGFHGDGSNALARKENLTGLLKLAASRL